MGNNSFINNYIDKFINEPLEIKKKRNIVAGKEVEYLKRNGKTVDDFRQDVMPKDYEKIEDLDLKNKIIDEALSKGILIYDCESFLNQMEGILRTREE